MIGIVIISALTVATMLLIFLVTGTAASKVDVTASKTVDIQLDQIRKRSVITSTMNDVMWRSGIEREKYGDRRAYKIISYFFSNDGPLYIGGNELSREEVRNDLKEYLRYKMNTYWKGAVVNLDYYLEISASGSGVEPVAVGTYEPTGRHSLVSFPLALEGGEEATVRMWTKTFEGVQSLETRGPR